MQRKVTLGKGAYLWDAGDSARNLAVLESGRLGVRAEGKLIGLITPKMVLGESALLTLDGTSLTVNEVDGDTFSVLLIPHSLNVTTWGKRREGDRLNLEVDLMARYAARLAEVLGD